jgi:hypothetical protein
MSKQIFLSEAAVPNMKVQYIFFFKKWFLVENELYIHLQLQNQHL